MMYTTRTIDVSHTSLMVGKFFDDSVLARTPQGEVLRIPRFCIETPVLCCSQCGKNVVLKHDVHKNKDFAECPDRARHMYEQCYTASHDIAKYNRKARHMLRKQSALWLNKWRRAFEESTNIKVESL